MVVVSGGTWLDVMGVWVQSVEFTMYNMYYIHMCMFEQS